MTALFDAAALQSGAVVLHVIELDRIEVEGDTPTLTIRLDDKIRKQERKILKETVTLSIRQFGKGTRQTQEMIPQNDRAEYVDKMLALCCETSTGLLDTHNTKLLQIACLRDQDFMKYLGDEISAVFEGDIKIREAEEEEQEKN